MNETSLFSSAFLVALFASGVRQSIPLIYGSVGDTLGERAGVMGISLEVEMLFGAFFSYLFALRTGSLWTGVLMGALAGMLSSVIVAVWSVLFRQDQSIIGIMFNILAVGFTNFLNRMIFGTSNANITIETFQPIAIPGLSRVPVLGEIFFNQNILTYLSVVLAAVVFWVLRKTKLGLQLTAVGENPKAAQASGIQVYRFRILAYMFCGFAAGIGIAVILLNYYSVSLSKYVSSTATGSVIALGVIVLALGAVIRYLTKNDNLAYAFSFILLLAIAAVCFIDSSKFEGLLPRIMEKLSLFERFYTFVNGVFDMTAIVYFLSVIVFFLFLSVQSLEKRRYN